MVHSLILIICQIFLPLHVIIGLIKIKKSKNTNIKKFVIKLVSILCVFSILYFSSIIITEKISYSNPSEFLLYRYGYRDSDIIEEDVFINVSYFQRIFFEKTERSYRNLNTSNFSGEDILLDKNGQVIVLSTSADYIRNIDKTYVFICCNANAFFDMDANISYDGKECNYVLIDDGKYIALYFQKSGKLRNVQIEICGKSQQIHFSKLDIKTIMKLNTIKIKIE